jgi:autotransporter adhesin
VTNVANGTQSTDAVNLGQAQSLANGAQSNSESYTDSQIAGVTSSGCRGTSDTLACGTGATTDGSAGTLAVGINSSASFAGSVAIGRGAVANADPTVAIGDNSQALATNSVAVGANSVATTAATNSVALGQGSQATRANTVSVGNEATGLTRQIAGVAAGTAPTDAVNVTQLNSAVDSSRRYAARGVAAALASPPPVSLAIGKQYLGVETSYYDGEAAIGLGYAYQLSDQTSMNLAVSGSPGSGPIAVRGGVGVSW